MLNYTKGEWKLTDCGINIHGVRSLRIGCIIKKNGTAMDYHIAYTDSYDNGTLIAAAPDMYEALKYAMRIIEAEHIVVPYKCEQAIAKVEGK